MLSHTFCMRVKSVNSHKDGAGRDRHPRNCDRCWLLMSFWRVNGVNSHRDEAGRGRHPRNFDRFWLLISIWIPPKKKAGTRIHHLHDLAKPLAQAALRRPALDASSLLPRVGCANYCCCRLTCRFSHCDVRNVLRISRHQQHSVTCLCG